MSEKEAKHYVRPNNVSVKNADMPDEMQTAVFHICQEKLDSGKNESGIADLVRKELDREFSPTWHVAVGQNFGAYVTHEAKNFVYFYLGARNSPTADVGFLVFKSG